MHHSTEAAVYLKKVEVHMISRCNAWSDNLPEFITAPRAAILVNANSEHSKVRSLKGAQMYQKIANTTIDSI